MGENGSLLEGTTAAQGYGKEPRQDFVPLAQWGLLMEAGCWN